MLPVLCRVWRNDTDAYCTLLTVEQIPEPWVQDGFKPCHIPIPCILIKETPGLVKGRARSFHGKGAAVSALRAAVSALRAAVPAPGAAVPALRAAVSALRAAAPALRAAVSAL
ncbi:MAG: hypothetical protein LBC51_11225, partial [Treponema sp.]|nr:hypothetical protein [Treponema sp.]